jgi:hypothetical protein
MNRSFVPARPRDDLFMSGFYPHTNREVDETVARPERVGDSRSRPPPEQELEIASGPRRSQVTVEASQTVVLR